MRIIPTVPFVTEYEQRTQLDGIDYVLRIYHNARVGRWYIDIATEDGTPIASGRKLVTAWPIARLARDPRRPTGTIMVVDQEADIENGGLNAVRGDPAFCNLGGESGKFLVVYFEAAEIAAGIA